MIPHLARCLCGNPTQLRIRKCEDGEHWHLYIVCICVFAPDDGIIEIDTPVDQFGDPFDES